MGEGEGGTLTCKFHPVIEEAEGNINCKPGRAEYGPHPSASVAPGRVKGALTPPKPRRMLQKADWIDSKCQAKK